MGPVVYSHARFFRLSANASAWCRSFASGLLLFSPPKYFRKLFVFHAAHPKSPITVYIFTCNFSWICW